MIAVSLSNIFAKNRVCVAELLSAQLKYIIFLGDVYHTFPCLGH